EWAGNRLHAMWRTPPPERERSDLRGLVLPSVSRTSSIDIQVVPKHRLIDLFRRKVADWRPASNDRYRQPTLLAWGLFAQLLLNRIDEELPQRHPRYCCFRL